MFAAPHGFHIDPEGNFWATDYNGSETVLGMDAGGRGHQVFKFSPDGEILMTLGRAGVAGNGPDTFDRPTDVAVNADGDIFVTDGHGPNNRVVKFDRNGRFLMTWGGPGDGPGEFDQPHTLTLDSRGRVFVGDRSNGRVQIFTDRLIQQRHASPHTVAAYRDAWRRLIRFAATHLAKAPSQLELGDLDAPLIGRFLAHLELDHANTVRTRNARLSAIHAFFRTPSARDLPV